MGDMKRAAADRERPASVVMRVMQNVAPAAQAQFPELENIRKTIQREKSSNLPKNPTNIQELLLLLLLNPFIAALG